MHGAELLKMATECGNATKRRPKRCIRQAYKQIQAARRTVRSTDDLELLCNIISPEQPQSSLLKKLPAVAIFTNKMRTQKEPFLDPSPEA
ncbi:hypothetical protein PM082_008664 [Marasmius tenuissimus]|nr:hypothetical protein PM082_008664 [Marasmius tenuissimus]